MKTPPQRPILAFAGLAGAGKTTAARAVAAFAPQAIVRPLAHGLKTAAHQLFGDFGKSSIVGDRNGREIYQSLGDYARAIDPYFALRRILEFQEANQGRNLIIDDLRTTGEAEWVTSHPQSVIVWVRPRHDTRTIEEIQDEAEHSTEALEAAQYADYHHYVSHRTPAMLGEEVTELMSYYAKVFG